ncbi:hypothetical protein CKO09_01280 [Chromatium weissei]|nr:hypothetical protein [Chromatium weissei]
MNEPEAETASVQVSPRLVTNDLRLLLKAAIHGVGIALLPEQIVANALKTDLLTQVLPNWTTTTHHIYLLYPSPRGMLPSVRSLIDYLLIHLPISLQKHSIKN